MQFLGYQMSFTALAWRCARSVMAIWERWALLQEKADAAPRLI
jgi:hypothetical protein